MSKMKKILKTSDFGTGLTELYVYQSAFQTDKVVLLLKGIYGYHFELGDFKTDLLGLKWDQAFVRHFLEYSHVICVNTSRKEGYDQSVFSERRLSFEGKDFREETSDVRIAFECALEMLSEGGVNNPEIHLIGKSFGGTTLLGIPEIVSRARSVSMLASGCGRSETTTRPLLRTLPGEEELLKTISDYSGHFFSYRGTLDDVVPIESQEKIVRASGAKVTSYVTIIGADHEFEKMDGQDSLEPGTMIRKMLVETIKSNQS
jgi:hypothetical protein